MERRVLVKYYRAWYRLERDGGTVKADFPDWIVCALDEGDAVVKVLYSMNRAEPERHFRVFLDPIDDEDEATVLFAEARQNGQALL